MVQETPSVPAPESGASVASELARRLSTAHKAQAVAMAATIEVEVALTAIASHPHLTTSCAWGAHDGCQFLCGCRDCNTPCECDCHQP